MDALLCNFSFLYLKQYFRCNDFQLKVDILDDALCYNIHTSANYLLIIGNEFDKKELLCLIV